MQLSEIEQNVSELDLTQGFDLLYDLLRAYGIPNASITRLQKGTYDKSTGEDERLWKGKVYYRLVSNGEDLHAAIDGLREQERIVRSRPRFLIVRDATHLLAVDTRTETTLDTPISDLPTHAAFFMPWAGIEKTQLESLNYADVKAAEKLARLYDEVIKHNTITTDDAIRHLNVFFSRLLFCFFAEDTEVFQSGLFTNSVASLTAADGSDTASFLDELFRVLNTDVPERVGVPAHLSAFGYVNGNLFDQEVPSPQFSARARRIVLECGTLDWSLINPDIFGSMIQAVVHPSQRGGLGMHYTSVENIMKVIRPLFLDDLYEAFDAAATVSSLERLLERVCSLKVFDPACGSGNFLVIAFKELRKLEHQILLRISERDPTRTGLFKLSGVKLENFFGIEVDDFAHEIAILSLWLAKHQMNIEFRELFGVEISLIPLKDSGNIVCDNATRVDWESVCPKTDGKVVQVLGNPPYIGSSMQRPEHKADFVAYFGTTNYPKNLDYISLWFFKGAEYIHDGRANLAFVATNSVSQGDHTGLMWPRLLEQRVEIAFAHQSFKWNNQARGNAGVTCVIIGLSANPPRERKLFASGQVRLVPNINPYLAASHRNTIVLKARNSVSGLPEMVRGSQPTDGGNLILSPTEAADLVRDYPEAAEFVKAYVGSGDYLSGTPRCCLWIPDEARDRAAAIEPIACRLERVTGFRNRGSTTAQAMADQPHRFLQRAYKEAPSIIVPSTSSEQRQYIPMGFLDANTVISNLAYAIYDAGPWLFGLVQSRMHMVWVDTVAGRMKSDYRYSVGLCYNAFPAPTDHDRDELENRAFGVLDAREQHADKSLAELYKPDKMPLALTRAHADLDAAVDKAYRARPFGSDTERLEHLFALYEQSTGLSGAEE